MEYVATVHRENMFKSVGHRSTSSEGESSFCMSPDDSSRVDLSALTTKKLLSPPVLSRYDCKMQGIHQPDEFLRIVISSTLLCGMSEADQVF